MASVNEEVAALLREYAELLVLVGGDQFRVRSYEKAAKAVGGYLDDLGAVPESALTKVPGVGKSVAAKVESKPLAERAQIVLYCAEERGEATLTWVAGQAGVSRETVRKWRVRFMADRTGAIGKTLADNPRPGRPHSITDQQIRVLDWIDAHKREKPERKFWSAREIAKDAGVSRSSALRILRAHGLKQPPAEQRSACRCCGQEMSLRRGAEYCSARCRKRHSKRSNRSASLKGPCSICTSRRERSVRSVSENEACRTVSEGDNGAHGLDQRGNRGAAAGVRGVVRTHRRAADPARHGPGKFDFCA
jgi:transposase